MQNRILCSYLADWPAAAYILVGRDDIAASRAEAVAAAEPEPPPPPAVAAPFGGWAATSPQRSPRRRPPTAAGALGLFRVFGVFFGWVGHRRRCCAIVDAAIGMAIQG
jgi:hypothetical protein